MLTARRRMLSKLNTLVENRRAIISQLGMELLQTARVRATAIQTRDSLLFTSKPTRCIPFVKSMTQQRSGHERAT